ncbi:DNA/RNA nuclease SfsA [Gilvimarinus sp. F26214L]|uniref:DNA/RNA nuclease SfsA n=1 Tax=Gilvimarinus sp. DZF01 TaxID=3461371 RepID=UPI004045FA55
MTTTTQQIFRPATFLRRYKRFLADVRLEDGREITVHCPNTGAMTNCLVPNSPCWISESHNTKRKYPHTWEIATTPCGNMAGINTNRANHLVQDAIRAGLVHQLEGYRSLASEVRYGSESSRIDLLLEDHPNRPGQRCYVEVKNVTFGFPDGRGLFPDAVSARASKHLRELMAVAEEGHRAVLFFCVQHSGIEWVEAAQEVDPAYAEGVQEALARGVEVIAYRAKFSDRSIMLDREVPFRC